MTERPPVDFSGVDLTGLPPRQAYRLGLFVAELIAAAEDRGVQSAIQSLRDKDSDEAAEFDNSVRADPRYWDGWPYAHPYRKAADYLEALGS